MCVEGKGGGALTRKLCMLNCVNWGQIQKYNYLNNVEHVVKLTFRNLKTLIWALLIFFLIYLFIFLFIFYLIFNIFYLFFYLFFH